MLTIERRTTDELSGEELRVLRVMLDAAFSEPDEAFGDDDWEHGLGGVHVVARVDGEIVGHAAVVARQLEAGDRRLDTGYVEAVAVAPAHQGRGYGAAVMREVAKVVDERYELGALGTGVQAFYERLGWERWLGPTYVRTPAGLVRTPDEDGGILILRTRSTPALDLTVPLSCEWRTGDVW